MENRAKSPPLTKAILLGDPGVGKTTFLEKMGLTPQDDPAMARMKIGYQNVPIRGGCQLQIWDPNGQEKLPILSDICYSGTLLYIILFDVSDIRSFEHAKTTYASILKRPSTINKHECLLVGNDNSRNERQVDRQTAETWCAKHGIFYMDCDLLQGTYEVLVSKLEEIMEKINFSQ